MRRAVIWLRRDLSLADNPAWARASSCDQLACVWVLESWWSNCGQHRLARLAAAVRSLEEEVAAVGGRLTILRGPAEIAIPRFAATIGATNVFWNSDVTGPSQRRDDAVQRGLAAAGISWDSSWGTLVHPPGSVLTDADAVPRVFKRFFDRWSVLPVVSDHTRLGATVLDLAGDATLDELPTSAPDANSHAANQRLELFLSRVDNYETNRNRPDLNATSHLSADLGLGLISAREVVRRVGTSSASRNSFVRQIAWRDWFAHLFYERPDLAVRAQQAHYDTIEWRNDPAEIEAWRTGHTGYPFVDAAMRELAATGWVHGRVRMVAASFLVKDLLVDWRVGETHFRHHLIDGDVAQNAGNWQWVAGTGPDAAPYFRVLNPTLQAQRYDPTGAYVRRWVPELAGLAGARVHVPAELNEQELTAAGVVLGENYPVPLVEHSVARARAMLAYANARRPS